MCGPRKHNCQPFCGPEGRFDCNDSVCSLRPAPLSYLCVRVWILGVLKFVCCCTIKPDCCLRLLWSPFLTDSAACVLSFNHSTPLHIYMDRKTRLSMTPVHMYMYIYIVQQLSINVELQVQHLSRPDSIEYCRTFLWKSSESELETLVFQKQTTLTVKKVIDI